MTNFTENEARSPNQEPEVDSILRNLERLKLDLEHINQETRSFVYGGERNENWGPSRYLRGNGFFDDGEDTSSENYSVLNYTDGDDDTLPLLRCHFCEFDIEFSVLRDHSEDVHSFDPKNMVCPVCEENLGEDAIKAAQMLSSRKRNWKSEKYSTSSGNSAMLDKKHAAWGNRHEPMSDPLLSLGNVSVPRVSDIQSSPSDFQSDEDSISVASDISIAKSSGTDAPDSGDEQGREERNMRAAFAQELVLSTLFLE